jgi:Tol biopolymer transport system component
MDSRRWQEIAQLYEAALAVAAADRAAFVRAASSYDSEVRADVASILAAAALSNSVVQADVRTAAAAREHTPPLTGQRLAHYTIGPKIGSGGMGEVYRARDEMLGRDVAIKFLPSLWLTDPDRRARFDREARLLAALNHPHIAAIYGIADGESARGLVLELVEGSTLGERLQNGRLPLDQAIDFGRQIAVALELAHEKGIVHRDLKPANIKVTPENVVKVLDFGLAKWILDGSPPQSSAVSTGSDHVTVRGAVLGTPPYMSPEQARGVPVDKRADIWAFGCVLYEMLTGRRAFAGATPFDTIASILRGEPDWRLLPDNTPSSVRRLLERCLQKDPKRRLRDIGEARIELDEELSARRPSSRSLVVAAGVAAVGVVVGSLLWRPAPIADAAIVLDAPQQLTAGSGWEAEPALAPDGGLIAFTSAVNGNVDVWLMDVKGGNLLRLTDDAASDRSAAWMPDGSSLVFVSDRGGRPGIWKVSRLGGLATMLVDNAEDPAVSPDGAQIAFVRRDASTFYRVMVAAVAAPQSARQLTSDNDGLWDHREPAWSPDGSVLAYHAARDLWQVSLADSRPRRLTDADAADREPAWSPDGRFVYFSSNREGTRALWRVSVATGAASRLTGGQGPERQPSVARDNSRIVYSTFVDDTNIVVHDLRSGREQAFGGDRREEMPVFAPDSRRLAFVSDRWMGRYDVWLQQLSGAQAAGEPRRLTDHPGSVAQPAFSPDGRWVAYYRVVDRQRDIWIVAADGAASVQFTHEPSQDLEPAWSPRGDQLAFISDREHGSQLWTAPVADGKAAGPPRRLTSGTPLLGSPAWSPDGAWIAFVGGDADIWIVEASGASPPQRVTRGADVARVCWNPVTGALWAAGTWGSGASALNVVDVKTGAHHPVTPPVFFDSPIAVDFDLSPDARWLVYAREQRRGDLWVQSIVQGSER